MAKRGDGVRSLGAKFGRKWFEIRLTYIDPRTGKKRDTKKKIQADSKFLAAAKRDELLTALRAGKPGPGERKPQPGDVSPDMHACERAIRDLALLERVRAHPDLGWLIDQLEHDRGEWLCWVGTDAEERPGEAEARAALLGDVAQLLSPGDAGRGEGGGDDAR